MSFTPGPWAHEPTNSASLSYVAVSTVGGANGNTVVIGQCAGPDRDANARLIAAAPMLVEACDDAVKAFRLLRMGMAGDAKAVEVIDAHISELEYAIAKATEA